MDRVTAEPVQGQPTTTQPEERIKQEDAAASQVPPNINMARNERLVENVIPPARAVEVEKVHSGLGDVRDSIVSFAYGPEKILKTPQSITTDSTQRIIVADAAAHAIHVLAYTAKDSFRIVGGADRYLQTPSGVAVDRDDNIYVSDSERRVIVVFDSEGRFIRDLGIIEGEGQFEKPTGIAIDRERDRLYVLDTPRHLLMVLDLQGKMLARIGTTGGAGPGFGTRQGSTKPGRFLNPTAVVVAKGELIVLDATRIQILDLNGKFLKEISIAGNTELPSGAAPGLCVDVDGNVYVSNPEKGGVRVYNHGGQLLSTFGRPGTRMGEFEAPAGMWIDSTGRVYLADFMNRRIQVFQLTGPKG
jgi:DNA-binding beta-propeller fold protein YncE